MTFSILAKNPNTKEFGIAIATYSLAVGATCPSFIKGEDVITSQSATNPKIGEKISIRKSAFFGNDKLLNFSYTHSSIKKNIGKIGVLLSIETIKEKKNVMNLGKQLAMQIASSSPYSSWQASIW